MLIIPRGTLKTARSRTQLKLENKNLIDVVCVKTGTKYGPEYVNHLQSMVKRHLSVPHCFYCITEDPVGLNCEILPVTEENLPGWWQKITIFKSDPYGLKNPILFLDLDVVITGSLDELVKFDGNLRIIKDWSYPVFNSSVFLLKPGSHPEVWDRFTLDVIDRFYGDQEWMTEVLKTAEYWPSDWVISYKRSIRRRMWFNHPVPDNARVVVFHGNPKPHQVEDSFVRENWK